MIVVETPTKLRLVGYEDKIKELKSFLTFTDTSVLYEIKRFKNNRWLLNKIGEEAWTEQLNELKDRQKICLLEEDDKGLYTYTGLANDIAAMFNDYIVPGLSYPSHKLIPWHNEPTIELRPYQEEAIKNLLHAKHGGVSLPTGSGKSACILQIVKELGLKTVVMAPSVSIANQLYDLFVHHFGTKYVGYFGDGKKKTDKRITIGIAQSLTRIEEGSKAWTDLNKADIFIADESHLTPAETLKKVCMGLLGDCSYRFFFSATQMRNDGADLLLKAIIGPIVLNISSKYMVENGYLAKPNFIIMKSKSQSSYNSSDVLRMLSAHLYNNAYLHQQAANLANMVVKELGHQVLIMIDHVEQHKYLLPHLKYLSEFAHGGVSKANKDKVDVRFHKSDPSKLVEMFNDGKIPILIGTSCISTGTDIKPVDTIINLQGGKSEVKFLQLLGRGTRLTPKKKEFNFVDFNIENVPILENHTTSRIKIYKSFYDSIRYVV